MDPHTVSFNTEIGMHTYCAEWEDGDLPCGVDWASDIIEAEFPHLHGVTFWVGMDYLLFHPSFIWACVE